jgi:ribosomal protein S18 acetylase RimI-like enzyme
MGEVTVRRAIAADLRAVTELLDELDTLHREALPWLLRKPERPHQAEFIEGFLSKEDHALLLATTASGTVAGLVAVFLRQPARAPVVRPALAAELDALAVSSSFRRRGVGTALVRAALSWSRERGATRTELGVYEFNEPARAFWESLGFRTLSRRLVAHADQLAGSERGEL